MSVYTMGIWQAKPGREDEFVAAWWEFARWSSQEFEVKGSTGPLLLRDREQPGRFVSVGPWETVEQIAAWRAHPAFQERVGIRDFLESFTPATLDPVPPAA